MKYDNPLYQKQGIHTVNSIFTIEEGELKVLLIKRKEQPFMNMWALVSGAVYNNETFEDGTNREILEKTGLKNLKVKKFEVFSDINRAPEMRMIAIANICVIDATKVHIVKNTKKTHDAKWFAVNELPDLAFDHKEIFDKAKEYLKEQVYRLDMVKAMVPKEFTMPMLHSVYETALNEQFDRRNFSKKMLSLGILIDLNKTEEVSGKKPAKLYCFNNKSKVKTLF